MVGWARVSVPQRGGSWAEEEEGDQTTRHQAQGEPRSQGEDAGELHTDTSRYIYTGGQWGTGPAPA